MAGVGLGGCSCVFIISRVLYAVHVYMYRVSVKMRLIKDALKATGRGFKRAARPGGSSKV